MSLTKTNNKFKIKNKIVCKYFILGKCIKGKNCPYLHSQIDKENIECPMYSIGYCKNGPLCQFSHIKKDKYSEEDSEEMMEEEENEEIEEQEENNDDEDATSSTPLAEDYINDSQNENNNFKIDKIKNNIVNNNKESNNKISENFKKYINKNDIKKDKNFHVIPIWYLEHYYDKPISLIFSELESQNLPEVISLKKKYGFSDSDNSTAKKNGLSSNTLNLNFNNFNMNFDLNRNVPNLPIQNQIYSDFIFNSNYSPISENHLINKDQIEYIINKDINIYYYLIKMKKYKEVKKSYESSIIKLPEILYDKFKNIDLFRNDLTIIIIIYNNEYDVFSGFAKLQYPFIDNEDENESEIEQKRKNLYKIEWLWKNPMPFSEVCHLMNKSDNDHFLNGGKNGCPIHNDLGNYICRLMIKRLSKEEVIELMNEKEIFNNQIKFNQYLQNLKRYKYDYDYDDYYYNEYEYDDDYYYDEYNYNYYNNNHYSNYDKEMPRNKYKNISQYEKNKFEYDDEYYKKKYKKINKISKERSEFKNERKHKKRYRSRSRSKSRNYYYSEKSNKRHKRRKKSDIYSNNKHKKNKENTKKIYSQIYKE